VNNFNSDQDKINDLIAKLDNNDGSVREQARSVLIDIGKEAVPGLTKALTSKTRTSTVGSCQSTSRHCDPDSIPALVKSLQDQVFDIRWLAAEALIAIGEETIEPLLRAVIDQENESFISEGAHHIIANLLPSLSKSAELKKY